MPKCGANFRKPVETITDRAKRYRAHSPGCRPKGPKKCFKCGSRRFVVPDHIDGDESNGRRSNLRWACKSHNTILGKKMARAGKGVRTRQYNPGAKSLGAYVSAAVSHARGAHDEAGKVIHDTPKAKRREFARQIWDRRRMHNPELPDDEKATHASVKYVNPSQVRGQHCSNCEHYIPGEDGDRPACEGVKGPISPKAWCKNFVKLGANPRRKNSEQETAADWGYRKFHGVGPDRHYILRVGETDPYGNHPELYQCGFLIRFIVGEGVVLKGQYGDEPEAVSDEFWVEELNFLKSTTIRQYHDWLEDFDPATQAEVNEVKRWLRQEQCPDVAGVPDYGKSKNAPLASRQLYIVGGNQNIDDKLEKLGADPQKDFCDLGYCYLIEYFTQKKFDGMEPTNYWHHFGEKTKEYPRLIYDRIHHQLKLAGGSYVVKSVGIDN